MTRGDEPQMRVGEAGVILPEVDEIPPELKREAEGLLETLRRARAEPPAVKVTAAARLLLKRGEAVRLSDGLLADADVAKTILEEIKSACREEGEISLAGLRDRLGTSRKYAQAWLEYSDEEGITRRTGEVRVLTRRYR